jgi:hypothetical protein
VFAEILSQVMVLTDQLDDRGGYLGPSFLNLHTRLSKKLIHPVKVKGIFLIKGRGKRIKDGFWGLGSEREGRGEELNIFGKPTVFQSQIITTNAQQITQDLQEQT